MRTAAPSPRRQDYVEAVRALREFTRAPDDCNVVALLIRAGIASPAAADVLIRSEMRTRAHRRAAAIAAALAMAAELDEAEAAASANVNEAA